MTTIRCPNCGLIRDKYDFEELNDTDIIGCARLNDDGRYIRAGCSDCAIQPTFSEECNDFLEAWKCKMLQVDGELVDRLPIETEKEGD